MIIMMGKNVHYVPHLTSSRCEQAQEEQRLLAMVSNSDNPLLKDEAKVWEEHEKKKKTLAESLRSQLDEREAMKYLEKKTLEHERVEMKKIWEMQDVEDIVTRNAALEKKAKLGKELLQDQLQQLEKKKMFKAWDRQEDEQVGCWLCLCLQMNYFLSICFPYDNTLLA